MSIAASVERFGPYEEFAPQFSFYLKDRLGPGFYLSKSSRSPADRFKAKVGVSVPEIIDDAKTGARTIRFRNYDSVFVADGLIAGDSVHVTIPAKAEIHEGIRDAMRARVQRTEGTLLRQIHQRLIKIPLVQVALTPISEIIRIAHKEGKVRLKDVSGVRGSERAERYLLFLEGLGMLQPEGPMAFAPGPNYRLHRSRLHTDESLYEAILGEVLERGHAYLAQYLRLSQIVPYVRVSNSYFLPARYARRLIYMSKESFQQKYLDYYGRPKTISRMFEHVESVRKVRVFDPRVEDYIVADAKLFERYAETPMPGA